ncbi:hypothetical protein SO802_026190 [Lithocarpus litseifolius]|uniref:Uncharacterized protein n=1 Tax=Lithocarpus litseifolius TaxID=425828 RepID=A0AAW2BYT2_9ROSI
MHPKLKSRYKSHVEAAIECMKTINDFDDLVDLRTLAHHCLGLKPSAYVLRAIKIEEKKMTTKFNQEMYAKMRAKKNEPLSNLRKRVIHVVEKGTPVTSATSVPEVTRIASPTTSVEEITPRTKKPRLASKGKEKTGSRSSSSGGDHSHYLRVLESGDKGHLRGVQVARSGGRELKAKEGPHLNHGQCQYCQGEGEGPVRQLEGREAVDLGEGRATHERKGESEDHLVKQPTEVDLEVVDKEMAEEKAAQAAQVAAPDPIGDVLKPTDADGNEANA